MVLGTVGLLFIASQRVGHDWSNLAFYIYIYIYIYNYIYIYIYTIISNSIIYCLLVLNLWLDKNLCVFHLNYHPSTILSMQLIFKPVNVIFHCMLKLLLIFNQVTLKNLCHFLSILAFFIWKFNTFFLLTKIGSWL